MERDAGRWESWLGRWPLIAVLAVLVVITAGAVLMTGSAPKPVQTTSPAPAQTISPPTSQSVSFSGPPYDPELVARPTRDPVQSRVWFHAGAWWAVLLADDSSGTAGEHHIYRLDPAARRWIDTGTLVD